LGYSLNEIVDIVNKPGLDSWESIGEKIDALEKKKSDLEQLIGYAKAIKATGVIPIPKKMGSMRFKDYLKYSYQNWNIESDPQAAISYQILKTLSNPEVEWSEEDISQLFEAASNFDIEALCTQHSFYEKLMHLSYQDASHPNVQALVKGIYDYECEHFFSEYSDVMTPQKYAVHISSAFTGSDIALLNEKGSERKGVNL